MWWQVKICPLFNRYRGDLNDTIEGSLRIEFTVRMVIRPLISSHLVSLGSQPCLKPAVQKRFTTDGLYRVCAPHQSILVASRGILQRG